MDWFKQTNETHNAWNGHSNPLPSRDAVGTGQAALLIDLRHHRYTYLLDIARGGNTEKRHRLLQRQAQGRMVPCNLYVSIGHGRGRWTNEVSTGSVSTETKGWECMRMGVRNKEINAVKLRTKSGGLMDGVATDGCPWRVRACST